MRSAAVIICAVYFCATAAYGAPTKKAKAPKPPSLALVELEGLAAAADKAAVEDELRALVPSAGYELQKKDKTESTLSVVKKLGLACDSGDVDCLIRVGALGGVNVVLNGLLSVEGDAFALDLLAADVNGLRERGRVRVRVPRDGVERRNALDSALVGVLKPEAWRGQLRVTVAQRGASVVIDGVPRGFTPLSGPVELTPGPHAVFIGLEGFRAHKEPVEVVYSDEVGLDVTLVPGASEEPPFFTTAQKPPEPPPTPIDTPPPAPTKRKPLRVIIYDVEAVGTAPRTAQIIGTLLVAEVRKREGVSVLDSGELRALVGDGLTTTGDVRGCSEDQCFAEVAEALGADAVVVSQLTQVEGAVLFGLRRIDQQKQEVTASFLERVADGDDTLLLPFVGQSVAIAFADVPLRAGQKVGVDDRAEKILNPPPLSPIVSGSLTAGAIGAGVVGVGAGALALVWFGEYETKLTALAPNSELRGLSERFYGAQVSTYVGLGAAVVLGAAAFGTGMFTDWEGYASEAASRGLR